MGSSHSAHVTNHNNSRYVRQVFSNRCAHFPRHSPLHERNYLGLSSFSCQETTRSFPVSISYKTMGRIPTNDEEYLEKLSVHSVSLVIDAGEKTVGGSGHEKRELDEHGSEESYSACSSTSSFGAMGEDIDTECTSYFCAECDGSHTECDLVEPLKGLDESSTNGGKVSGHAKYYARLQQQNRRAPVPLRTSKLEFEDDFVSDNSLKFRRRHRRPKRADCRHEQDIPPLDSLIASMKHELFSCQHKTDCGSFLES